MSSVTKRVIPCPNIGTKEFYTDGFCEMKVIRDEYLPLITAKIRPACKEDHFLFPEITLTGNTPLVDFSNVIVLDRTQLVRLSENLEKISWFLDTPEVRKVQDEINELYNKKNGK